MNYFKKLCKCAIWFALEAVAKHATVRVLTVLAALGSFRRFGLAHPLLVGDPCAKHFLLHSFQKIYLIHQLFQLQYSRSKRDNWSIVESCKRDSFTGKLNNFSRLYPSLRTDE